jgi:hypothetical protein
MDPIAQFLNGMTQISGTQIGAVPSKVSEDKAGVLQRLAAGIPRSSIAAAGTYDAQITNSEPFRPDRIVLNTAAQALDVTNVRIGTKSLNVTSNPISGNCFAEDAVGTQLQGYTAQPGVGFVISFANNTAGAITTSGGVFGWALN